MEDTIGTIDRHVHIEYANNDQKTSEPKIFAKIRLAIRLVPLPVVIGLNQSRGANRCLL